MNLLYFATSGAAGLIGWSTIFATIIWPKMKGQPRKEQLKSLTAIHFFRYFGTTMLMLGLVVAKLPTGFTNFAVYGDLITLILAYIAFVTLHRSRNDNIQLFPVWLLNVFGAGDLLLALVLGPLLIKDPANFGFAYFIPTFYVPLLLVAHFYAFKTLKRSLT